MALRSERSFPDDYCETCGYPFDDAGEACVRDDAGRTFCGTRCATLAPSPLPIGAPFVGGCWACGDPDAEGNPCPTCDADAESKRYAPWRPEGEP